MCSDYEKAYESFYCALIHSPRNPAAFRYLSLTALVKDRCRENRFPDHDAIRQGWFDIMRIPDVINNPVHFAHKNTQVWRTFFHNTGFFPGIIEQDLWRDFSAKFPKLYHAVPREREHTFARKGRLFFRTLTDLRTKEDKEEGVLNVESPMTIKAYKTESCVFCLSLDPKIGIVRKGGIVYEIVTERLMQNLLLSIEFRRENLEFSDVKYFGSNRPYESKQLGFYVSSGIVCYGEQTGIFPSIFVKKPDYSDEKEVRITVDAFSHGVDAPAPKYRLLTIGSGLFVNVPNPAEWCRKP